MTIHDLSFEHHPEGQSAGKRRLFRSQARSAAKRARRILTVSETVRQDIAVTYGIAPSRILVAQNAVDPVFHPHTEDELAPILARLGVRRPYVVALGGVPRRGLEVAIEAWRAAGLAERGVGLVAVHNEALDAEPGIQWVGRVADLEWAALLAGAEAFCYPTRFEGFGMPALEAAASGTPVVCARLPVLVEVLADAAEWCESGAAGDLAKGLLALTDNPERREGLRQAGLRRVAAAPGWDHAADVTVRAYREALREI